MRWLYFPRSFSFLTVIFFDVCMGENGRCSSRIVINLFLLPHGGKRQPLYACGECYGRWNPLPWRRDIPSFSFIGMYPRQTSFWGFLVKCGPSFISGHAPVEGCPFPFPFWPTETRRRRVEPAVGWGRVCVGMALW